MSRKKKHEHVNHERWLVSYADFITLLFAFFVVLFASSQTDKKKQMQVATAMQSAFTPLGVFEAHSKTPPLTDQGGAGVSKPASISLPFNSSASDEEVADHIRQLIQAQMAAGHIPPGSVIVHVTAEGIVVSLREIGFFPSGSAVLRDSSVPVVQMIGDTIPSRPLRVEGHTDDVPIHTPQFATNWELSTARAAAIARLLLARNRFNPEDFSAAGYAEFRPIASNATEEGRAQNRRVDIILLRRQAPSR